MSEDSIKLIYSYSFSDGRRKVFEIMLDRETLSFIPWQADLRPAWARLGNHKCENCPLDEKESAHCPIALNLARIAEEFKDCYSYEKVGVSVYTQERIYMKDTAIQEGLSPLIGVVMATSGCPVMEHMKPMVRFHLPFATVEETVFRMASMYLMSRYFLNMEGRDAGWSLDGLMDVYAEAGKVNRDFALRLADAAKKDANVNALVNLDCFATLVPLKADSTLEEIKRYFSAYLK